jgi:hypothetical protein
MRRRKRPQPEHRSPHEQRLREIVDGLVMDNSEKEAYVAFGHELARSVRRGPKMGDSPSEQRVRLAAVQSPFSEETKRIVQKWFGRGLSGHLMWLIGEAVLGKARIP